MSDNLQQLEHSLEVAEGYVDYLLREIEKAKLPLPKPPLSFREGLERVLKSREREISFVHDFLSDNPNIDKIVKAVEGLE